MNLTRTIFHVNSFTIVGICSLSFRQAKINGNLCDERREGERSIKSFLLAVNFFLCLCKIVLFLLFVWTLIRNERDEE